MPKQRELFKLLCPVVDDDDVICNREMTRREMKQDGMCWRCACKLAD